MAGSRAQARPDKGLRILCIVKVIQIQYNLKVGVGLGGAVGARYPPKGAESFSLIIRNPFRYGTADIAPLGRRKGVDLVKVQGSLRGGGGQRPTPIYHVVQ